MSDTAMMSDKMSDSVSDKRSVRGIGRHEWELASNAAKRAKRPIGEWLSEAIRAHVDGERQPAEVLVLPPAAVDVDRPIETVAATPTPPQIIANLQAYAAFLAMRGLRLTPRGQVMRQADRLMRQAMAEAGIVTPQTARRLAAPDH